ncbi:hypothetical protein EDD85DRAFT_810252 [Armillaria nabsnona]|nr:hypothetical protein EDD85DRAFT_810252 [Armillaria nabsnona]
MPTIYINSKRRSEFKYGPFFADYGPVPYDATEEYTIRSPSLSAQLAIFYNEILPGLKVDIPNPNKTSRSSWPSLLELAGSKLARMVEFQFDCETHIVRLCKGDSAPAPPTDLAFTASRWWYRLVYTILSRDDIELRDDDDDTEIQILLWAYMYDAVFSRCTIWANFLAEMEQLTDPVAPAYLPSGHCENLGFLTLLGTKVYTLVSALYTAETTRNHGHNSSLSQSPGFVDLPPISGDGLTDKTSFLLRRRNHVTT